MDVQALVGRLETLERRWRRLQVVGASLAALAAAAFLAGLRPTEDEVVRARTFVVVDDAGNTLGYFGRLPEDQRAELGYLGLQMRAPDGGATVDLFVGNDAESRSVAHLQLESIDAAGEGYAIARLGAGGGIAALGLTDDENTRMQLYADRNVAAIRMEADQVDENAPSAHGKGMLSLQLNSGAPSIEGRAKGGETVVKLPQR